MKKLFFFILTFIFITHPLLWAEEVVLTLEEAVTLALRDNRDVLLKIEEIKKAKQEIAESQAGLFPTLNFTGSRTYTRGYYPKDIGSTTTQTTIKQYLYKGGKTINTIQQNKYELEVSKVLLDKTKLETVLNVKKAFYTLALADEFAKLNKGILDNTREHLNSLQTRYLNGQSSESEVLKIKESLSSVEEAYEASLNQAESSLAILRNLLYLDESVKVNPEAKFIYQPKEIAYDEAFLKAMKSRPEIKQYEAQTNADKKAIEIAKADNRPSIYASWDYYSRSTKPLTFSSTKDWTDYNAISLTFSWPIFDGWETKAKVEQAIIDLKETQLLKEKTVKDIALELKNAYLSLKDALAKIKSTESQVDLYKNTLLVTQDKYKAGIASALDLDDASLGYEVAAFNQKQATYDYLLAKADFDKAAGGGID